MGDRARTLVVISLALFLTGLDAKLAGGPFPWPAVTSQAQASAREPLLASLLAKAAEYCGRLERAAFDFVCREEVSEVINPSLDVAVTAPPADPGWVEYSGPTLTISTARKIKNRYVYDYQCVRAGGALRETRTQLEENGKKKIVPNVGLKTSVVVYGTALLGPVGLFGERSQPDYDFRIGGEVRIDGGRVLVVEARPKPGAPPNRNLYGKAWFDPARGDILEIEWSESRVGRFDVFDQRGRLFNRTPRLVIRSEFSAEKNGIRFPSRLSIEEAYLSKAGRATVRSRTNVVYRDFKFFTVEVEVRQGPRSLTSP